MKMFLFTIGRISNRPSENYKYNFFIEADNVAEALIECLESQSSYKELNKDDDVEFVIISVLEVAATATQKNRLYELL